MKQPDLGKKIAELRQAKGLTQSELAEKCNLSSRTIQRIESADVTPRSYTIKLIFGSLDYDFYNSFGNLTYKLDGTVYRVQIWLEQFYKYVLELFNLKTNTMKKLMILSMPFILACSVFLISGIDTNAQDKQMIKAAFDKSSINFVKWFNSGQIDSLAVQYFERAVMIPDDYQKINGKENIKAYYQFLYHSGFRFAETKSEARIITDSIVVERGSWSGNIGSVVKMSGNYMTQWKLIDGKWFIENEMTNSDNMGKDFADN